MKINSTILLYFSFASTIFLSAFLLFQVQPIIGKYILPWFGGTSFVWITSLLFFQTLLLVGYLYSYLLTKLRMKYQLLIHFGIVGVITLVTTTLFFQWSSPITPGITDAIPKNLPPVWQVLTALSISVGLPYFLLSTTSTLLQKWFSLLPHNKSPYPLYALSNTGSLLAIISYPFFIEPFLTLQKQGFVWSLFFIILCLLLIVCTFLSFKVKEKHTEKVKLLGSKISAISKKQYAFWFFLPAVSSIILLAGTHHLTQGIAPIPFLWLLPLGLYLVSFILCFSDKPIYFRNFYAYVFLITVPFILAFVLQPVNALFIELVLFGAMLFSCFMLCHGELYYNRPKPEHLNKFYLIMAFGSVIGAIIVAIVAPVFFVGLFWELLLGLFFTTLVAVYALGYYENSLIYNKMLFGFRNKKEKMLFLFLVVLLFYPIIGYLSFVQQMINGEGVWRNYYGTLRIITRPTQAGPLRCLINGKITHGCQSSIKNLEMQPTTYYGKNSMGIVFESLRGNTNKKLHVGVLGLGVGTVAAYGKQGDVITFYELNPTDVWLAQSKFTYLTKTPAKTEMVVGDGRLSLEQQLREGKKQNFDLYIIDAFNDDAIPVHLLTKEAFALYRNHLSPNGIIAVHISNSYLDLAPVVTKAAAYYNMQLLIVDAEKSDPTKTKSKWAFMTSDKNVFTTGAFKKAVKAKGDVKDIPIWTDDYSNLFQIITD